MATVTLEGRKACGRARRQRGVGLCRRAWRAGDGEQLDGAFRTGDTGRFDENGRLHLTGRIGSLVNIGRKINPSRDRGRVSRGWRKSARPPCWV